MRTAGNYHSLGPQRGLRAELARVKLAELLKEKKRTRDLKHSTQSYIHDEVSGFALSVNV